MNYVENKTLVITGASRGIGAAIARYTAAMGARVVLSARSEAAVTEIANEITAAGGQATALACDVSDYGQVSALMDHAMQVFGSIDVLVNNAGVIEPIARLIDSDPGAWGRIADVNYKGVYHGLRAAIPQMVGQGGGTIINISSGAATSALEGWSHYCSTKAAVFSLTRCADKEYRDQGLCVLGLSPGTVATDMQAAIKSSGLNPVSQLDPSAHIPPEWVAKTVHHLCGPAGMTFAGTDFSLKSRDAKVQVGLPVT